MDQIQPSIRFAPKMRMFFAFGIVAFIIGTGIISETTSIADGLDLREAFIVLATTLFFVSLLALGFTLLMSRAKLILTDEGILQQNLIQPVFIKWDEVKEFESRLGIRILRASNKAIQIFLEDFKDPNNVLTEIEAKLPSSVTYT